MELHIRPTPEMMRASNDEANRAIEMFSNNELSIEELRCYLIGLLYNYNTFLRIQNEMRSMLMDIQASHESGNPLPKEFLQWCEDNKAHYS
jgi:hypothetical protein